MTDEEKRQWYRERTAKWRKANPERAKELGSQYKRELKEKDPEYYRVADAKYNKKRRSELRDSYLRVKLSQRLGVPCNEVPVELIDLHRAVLTLKRLMKEQK